MASQYPFPLMNACKWSGVTLENKYNIKKQTFGPRRIFIEIEAWNFKIYLTTFFLLNFL